MTVGVLTLPAKGRSLPSPSAQSHETNRSETDKHAHSVINAQLEKELTTFIALLRMTITSECSSHPSVPAILERLNDTTDMNLFDVPEANDTQLYRRIGPLAKHVHQLFLVPTDVHQETLAELLPECSEENAASDLRFLLDLINQDVVYGLKRTAFASEADRLAYKDRENQAIAHILEGMRYSNYRYSTVRKTEWDPRRKAKLVFVPRKPRRCYLELLGRCVYRDIGLQYEAPVPPLGHPELLEASRVLLQECAKFWRILPPAHAITRLKVTMDMVLSREIPESYLFEALQELSTVHAAPDTIWVEPDTDGCRAIFQDMVSWIAEDIAQFVMNMEDSRDMRTLFAFRLLGTLAAHPVFQVVTATQRSAIVHEIADYAQKAALARYHKLHDLASTEYPASELLPLTYLATLVDQDSHRLNAIFPSVELDAEHTINIAAVTLERILKCLQLEVQNIIHSPQEPVVDLTKALDIYDAIYDLDRRAHAIAGFSLLQDELTVWLRRTLLQWVDNVEAMTPQWITNALQVETSQLAEGQFPYSSSVIDVSDILFGQIELLQRIQWPDPALKADVLRRFSRALVHFLTGYCHAAEHKFLDTLMWMTLGSTQSLSSQFLKRVGAIVAQATEEAQPVYFSIDSCVALNNLHLVEANVNRMYDALGVEEHLENPHRQSMLSPPGPPRYLISFHVVHAQGFSIDKAHPHPFVGFMTLPDKTALGRTRPSFIGTDPRWDEYVEFTMPSQTVNVLIAVQDMDDASGREQVYAFSSWTLDPAVCTTEVTRDLTLDLVPTGRLTLRVTVDQERDSTQFYFGKVFRTMQLTQSSLSRMIIQQMTPYMRQCLSRRALLQAVEAVKSPEDQTSASHRVTSGLNAWLKRNSLLTEKPKPQPGSTVSAAGLAMAAQASSDTLSDTASMSPSEVQATVCDQLLEPVTTYLNKNLAILFQNLHPGVSKDVVVKIWREMLFIFEDLLLPAAYSCNDKRQLQPLPPAHVDLIYTCLERLKQFFNGDDAANVSLMGRLESRHYYELLKVQEYYHLNTDDLVDLYISFKQRDELPEMQAKQHQLNRRKSVWAYGNRRRRRRLHHEAKAVTNETDLLLRILQLRGDQDAALNLSSTPVNGQPPPTATNSNGADVGALNQSFATTSLSPKETRSAVNSFRASFLSSIGYQNPDFFPATASRPSLTLPLTPGMPDTKLLESQQQPYTSLPGPLPLTPAPTNHDPVPTLTTTTTTPGTVGLGPESESSNGVGGWTGLKTAFTKFISPGAQ
ncbi:hypothetical protein H4R34_000383 [Dimargaris verticillata]|uniref:C2 domain-containing protein n=1 Tax=Dimargaris verticillata TaxID=2761393 RepID=A0A9W8EER1_9FUNG|nr:hypothetical protein H4R34_000383 [Dimargaris verticillata]